MKNVRFLPTTFEYVPPKHSMNFWKRVNSKTDWEVISKNVKNLKQIGK